MEQQIQLNPPCVVGDILYEIDAPEYGVIVCEVLWINYYNGPARHVLGAEIVSVWNVHVKVIQGHGEGSTYDFSSEDFGKKVFLCEKPPAEENTEGE